MPAFASEKEFRVAELFAGVGGFRLGLEGFSGRIAGKQVDLPGSGWQVVWANQWEPPGGLRKQFAFDCYRERFDPEETHAVNEDLALVLNDVIARTRSIPKHELLVGGFPCQDYSVAKPLSQAAGIQGKKGVLWWEIYRLLEHNKPRYVLLENVDRLLKSPASQRGRDFAVILSCFARLGYFVEWRVINAAEYGEPQRRRRVFIFAKRMRKGARDWDPIERLVSGDLEKGGVLARALPVKERESFESDHSTFRASFIELHSDPYEVSRHFGTEAKGASPFENAGVMCNGRVWTHRLTPIDVPKKPLGHIVRRTKRVSDNYYVSAEQEERWKYLKGPKSEDRVDKKTGFAYRYSEGGMVFPDSLTEPSRTILTGEGGSSPSRFKHVVWNGVGLRRLVPEELEELNGFPRGWTDTGMTDVQRAFCMGNALVVGIVRRIGEAIREEATGVSRTRTSPTTLKRRRKPIDEGQRREEHDPGALAS